jgi:hypothetical protein
MANNNNDKRYRIKQNKYSICGGGQSRRSAGWSRFRSAPLQIDTDNSSPKQQQQPLNDISYIFQLKHKLMLAAATPSALSTSSSSSSEEQNMTDLENLLYGNLENQQQILIKQSLEVDATLHVMVF